MKRLVVCCDGTWNIPDQESPTNIVKLALTVAPEGPGGVEQRVFYHEGVGTSRRERLRGGVTGMGLSRNVRACHRFLAENYDPGDELYLFGFSRGAFTARSLAGLIRNSGILRRQHLDKLTEAYRLYRSRDPLCHPRGTRAKLFRTGFSHAPEIRFLGVFDTVGALGVPLNLLSIDALVNRRWRFHDTDLSTHVEHAYQALAIDEKRGMFRPTLWNRQAGAPEAQVLEQVWFAGVHSDVGGGYQDDCSLAEIPLLWMADKAARAGLAFRPDAFGASAPHGVAEADARAEGTFARPLVSGRQHESRKGLVYGYVPGPHHRRPGTEKLFLPEPGRRRSRAPWAAWSRVRGEWIAASDQWISSSARDRRDAGGYAPPFLGEFLDGPGGGRVTDVRTSAGAP